MTVVGFAHKTGAKWLLNAASQRRAATFASRGVHYHVRSSTMPPELVQSSQAYFASAAAAGGQHTLPKLPYDYDALEPAISKTIMEIHHTKHHNTYVTNLNVALEKLDAALGKGDVSAAIALQPAIKFNGGGHLNHSLFWENLAPPNSDAAKSSAASDLQTAVDNSFGSFDKMKQELSAKSIAVQGSGWGWLGYNQQTGRLEVATCANQDPLHATTGLVPLLGIDVWEHAYYLDRQNRRPEYVEAIWTVINWQKVEERMIRAQKLQK